MRVVALVSVLLGLSATCQAQTQSELETRYVAACQKEDTEAFCRCEFKAMTDQVKDIKIWSSSLILRNEPRASRTKRRMKS